MNYRDPSRRPRVYTASKIHRAIFWRGFAQDCEEHITVNASWINQEKLDDNDVDMCKDGWIRNIIDVSNADYLMCYAEESDELSGTLVEIGAALAGDKPVVLIGVNHRWSTWTHHPLVIGRYQTVEAGVLRILSHWKNS